MKKITISILILCMLTTFTGCEKKDDKVKSEEKTQATQTSSTYYQSRSDEDLAISLAKNELYVYLKDLFDFQTRNIPEINYYSAKASKNTDGTYVVMLKGTYYLRDTKGYHDDEKYFTASVSVDGGYAKVVDLD